MKVELIYDPDCPNVQAAREAILRAFTEVDRPARWTEWERSAPESPSYARAFGSPTVLIDGEDVAPADPASAPNTCRLYRTSEGGLVPAPPVDLIVAGLRRGPRINGRMGFAGFFAALPTSGIFLLPIGACPACWPALAALLGALGLGMLVSERTLLPIAAAFLAFTLASLVYRASARRGYRPFLMGCAGAVGALIGKFAIPSDRVLYLGLGAIVAASVWNAWPSRQAASCPRCEPPRVQTQEEPPQ